MHQSWSLFKASWKLSKAFWYIALIDLTYVALVSSVFLFLSSYLQTTSTTLMAGQTVEEILQLAQTAPEQALPLLAQWQSFLVFSLGSVLLAVVGTVLFYAAAQALIWNYLLHQRFTIKPYWRWMGLQFAVLIPLLLYGVLALLAKLGITAMISGLITGNETFYFQHATGLEVLRNSLNGLVTLALILFFFILLFLLYFNFGQKHHIFESIGQAFHLLKLHWSKLWRMFILVVLTGILLNFLLSFLQRFFLSTSLFISTPQLFTILSTIVFLLFLAWLRVYVMQTVAEG